MKRLRRNCQNGTNQIGRGNGPPTFELVRPPEDNYFQLEIVQSKSFKQSHAAREIIYRAKLKNSAEDVPLNYLLPHLQALFDTILQETKREYGDAGVMRIYIEHPKLEKAIIIPPTYLRHLTSQKMLDYIDLVLYSAGEIPADDHLIINAAVVEFIEGSGRKQIMNTDTDLISKKSVIRITNNDNTCLPRAVIVGYSHLLHKINKEDKDTLNFYNKIRDSRCKLQGEEAKKLREVVGIPDNRPGNMDDVYKYEDYFENTHCSYVSKYGE